jgi:hypothetical protein
MYYKCGGGSGCRNTGMKNNEPKREKGGGV